MFFFVAGCLTCVQVLNIMVLLGFMLNYALRVNLTIAIVEMIFDDKTNHTVAAVTNLTETFNVTEVSISFQAHGHYPMPLLIAFVENSYISVTLQTSFSRASDFFLDSISSRNVRKCSDNWTSSPFLNQGQIIRVSCYMTIIN